MTTPTFKLLVNALRLGQPPEPLAAFKVLVEVIQSQENELADLRQRVNLLASRLQFAEAKATRMEAASLSLSGSHGAVSPAEPHAAIPAMPPIPRRGMLPTQPHGERTNGPPGNRAPVDLRSSEEIQDNMQGTLNVPRADIDAVVANLVEKEAPFPLAPPGGHRAPQETTGMPFKAARPLDPSGGSLRSPSAPREPMSAPNGQDPVLAAPSRPPPPMQAAEQGQGAFSPPYAASNRPRSVPPPPPPMRSPSVPYIAIEEVQPDTFSVTGEFDEVELPPAAPMHKPVAADAVAAKGPPKLQSILDESSYDDSVMTSVLRRKPGGQGD